MIRIWEAGKKSRALKIYDSILCIEGNAVLIGGCVYPLAEILSPIGIYSGELKLADGRTVEYVF